MSLKATIKTIHKMRKTILTVILSMSVILCFAQDAKEQIVTALQGQQEELTKALPQGRAPLPHHDKHGRHVESAEPVA